MKQLLFISLIFLLNCTTTKPLNSSGLNAEDRYFYVIQNGWEMSPMVKECFKLGKIIKDMKEDHIFMLYGNPDQNATTMDANGIRYDVWTYYRMVNKNVKVLLEVTFDRETRKVLSFSGPESNKCEVE